MKFRYEQKIFVIKVLKQNIFPQNSPVNMNLLLSMEYARIWLKEKNDFLKDRAKKAKPKFIKNDYWKWIEKRQPKAYKSCEAQGLKNLNIKGRS